MFYGVRGCVFYEKGNVVADCAQSATMMVRETGLEFVNAIKT